MLKVLFHIAGLVLLVASSSSETLTTCTSGDTSCSEEQDNVEMMQTLFERGESTGALKADILPDDWKLEWKQAYNDAENKLKQQQEELQGQVDDLKATLAQAEGDEVTAKQQAETKTKELNEKIEAVREENLQNIAGLQVENEQMKKGNHELLKNAEALLAWMSTEKEAESPSLIQKSRIWGWISDRIEKAADTIGEMIKEANPVVWESDCKEMEQTYKDGMDEATKQLAAVQTLIASSNQKQVQYKENVDKLGEELKKTEGDFASKLQKLMALGAKRQKAKESLETLVDDLTAIKTDIEKITTDIGEKTKEFQKLREELASMA